MERVHRGDVYRNDYMSKDNPYRFFMLIAPRTKGNYLALCYDGKSRLVSRKALISDKHFVQVGHENLNGILRRIFFKYMKEETSG